MNRNVAEVTFMAYKMKDNFFKTPSETEKMLENINKEVSKKLKTKKETDPGNEKIWSQEQQKALEAAIQKYPKQGAEDRWQKIANSVNGKTKEECQARYKYLVDLVKKQKNSIKPDENPEEVVEELKPEESEEEVLNVKTNGGKKRNKRKENKKNIDYSNLDDSENDSE